MVNINQSAIHRDMERQDRGDVVASCVVCGGKYRPAGGECIHEHPGPGSLRRKALTVMGYATTVHDGGFDGGDIYIAYCGTCQEPWRPGHTCIRQPTPEQVRELAEYGALLRRMDELIEVLAETLELAKPQRWEAM